MARENSARSEQLKKVAAEFCRIHEEWADDKDRPTPDQAYWSASDAMIESFDGGDIPSDCRALAEAVADFAEAVEEYDGRDNPTENLYPENDFWLARERIAAALKAFTAVAAPLPPLETIPSLAALPGITHLQIAKIYGFRDRHGNWLPQLVQKELDKPGSVLKAPNGIDGRPWRDPRLPTEDDGNQAAADHAEAIDAKPRRGRPPKGKPAEKPAPICPESPEELWRQKVSVSQAAKMLGKSEDEVAELFGALDERHREAVESGEIIDGTTQAIRELKSKGMDDEQIAETLNLTRKQVTEAIKVKKTAAA